ncbi:MAG: hypothetical protein AAF289_00265 [Cyanobacteria bacterium P01_A01_bin.135]
MVKRLKLSQWAFHPMVLVSLLIHGIVVFFPTWPQEEPESESPEDAVSIDLSTLPDQPSPPTNEPLVEVPQPVELPISEPSPQPPPLPASPPLPAPASVAPPAPSPTPEPASAPSTVAPLPNTEVAPALPPTSTPLPFADFPHLPSAEAGCFGLGNCRQTSGGNFRQDGAALLEQLTAAGYQVQPRDDLEDSGIKVFEVTKGGTTEYLSLLQPDLGQSVYVIAAEPVDLAELQASTNLESEFQGALRQVANGPPARYSDFIYPDFFFSGTALRPGVSSAPYTATVQPSDLTGTLTTQLEAAGFSVGQLGDYAGAPLYEVSQGAFVSYLSVVPTQDATGTVLLAWNQLPQPPNQT